MNAKTTHNQRKATTEVVYRVPFADDVKFVKRIHSTCENLIDANIGDNVGNISNKGVE